MKRQTHTIDAAGQVLGRLATEVAVLLRGKHKSKFAPHKDEGDSVIIKNIDKIVLTGRKAEQKKYYRHSGYPGALKERLAGKILEQNPADLFRRAVAGMLPNNKLKREQIKRLKFE